MKTRLDEATSHVHRMLTERFGEPIKGATPTVGITDDRSGKVASRGEDEEEVEDDDLLLDESVRYENYIRWLKLSAKVLGMAASDINSDEAMQSFMDGESFEEFTQRYHARMSTKRG